MTVPVLILPGSRLMAQQLRSPAIDAQQSFADLLDANASPENTALPQSAIPAPPIAVFPANGAVVTPEAPPSILPANHLQAPELPVAISKAPLRPMPTNFWREVQASVSPAVLEPLHGGGVGTVLPWNAGDRFDALGMFGRHDPTADLARDGVASAAVEIATGAPPPGDLSQSPTTSAASVRLTVASTPPDSVGVTSAEPNVAAAPAVETFAASLGMPPSSCVQTAEPEEPIAVQRAAPPRMRPPSPSPLGLHVAEVDGALSIAARVQGDVEQLRRAIEGTAAEFGLDVTELRLNGIEQPTTVILRSGGQHGSNTR